jgi:hypothetical protein
MIELAYGPEDCIEALGKIEQKDLDFLPRVYWGYTQNVGSGWAIVEAENEESARKMIPEQIRDLVQVTEVKTLTAELITAMAENAIEKAA